MVMGNGAIWALEVAERTTFVLPLALPHGGPTPPHFRDTGKPWQAPLFTKCLRTLYASLMEAVIQ